MKNRIPVGFILISLMLFSLLFVACEEEEKISWKKPDPYDDGSGDDQWYVDVCQIRTIFNFSRQVVLYLSNNNTLNLEVIYRVDDEQDRQGILSCKILESYATEVAEARFRHGDRIEIAVYTGAWEALEDLLDKLFEQGELPEEEDLLCSKKYVKL
ncbi:MAG: hypothetical protein QW303_07890 [Nitrososphaerota archaeon]